MTNETLPEVAPDASVDLGQAGCGDLTTLVRGRMRELRGGQVLEVFSEEQSAHEGIPAWCRLTGNELLGVTRETTQSRFLIRKK